MPEVIRIVDPVTESNGYVILEKGGCFVIDPNNFSLFERVFQERGIAPAMIFLTHGHCDHIGGLKELRRKYGIQVIASKECSLEMQDCRVNMSRMMEMFLYYKNGEKSVISYAPFAAEPADISFREELTIVFEGKNIQLRSLPGHTRGSTVICYENRIFSGDYLLPDSKVNTRLPGGNTEEYEQYAKPWLKKIGDGILVYPGHGEEFRMNEEVRRIHDL